MIHKSFLKAVILTFSLASSHVCLISIPFVYWCVQFSVFAAGDFLSRVFTYYRSSQSIYGVVVQLTDFLA